MVTPWLQVRLCVQICWWIHQLHPQRLLTHPWHLTEHTKCLKKPLPQFNNCGFLINNIFMNHNQDTYVKNQSSLGEIQCAIRRSLRDQAVYTLPLKLKRILTACAPRVAGPSCSCRRWILSPPPSHWWNAVTGSPPQTLSVQSEQISYQSILCYSQKH